MCLFFGVCLENGWIRGDLFLHTMTIMTICGFAVVLWIIGLCWIWHKQIRIMRQTSRLFQNVLPCELHMEELFEEVEHELGIEKGKVALVQSQAAVFYCQLQYHPLTEQSGLELLNWEEIDDMCREKILL